MIAKNLFSTVLIILMSITTAFSQAPAKKASAFEFITQQEAGEMHLEFDLTDLLNNKKTNDYYPAALTLEDGTTMSLEVRPRGKFRRRICEVPPLKLKFPKKEMRALGLDTLNEVRLVMPCSFSADDEARLLREYIGYKIYERLSPFHVKARLVHLTLRDKHVEKTKPAVWAIVLEHEEEIEARLNGKIEQNFGVSNDSLQIEFAAMNAVFQYMIGNTDWSLEDARNIYHLRPSDGSKIIPIPFDFDFSGLVDAPYATPTKESGLANVRERVLQTNGIDAVHIQAALQKVKAAEKELLAASNIEQLDQEHYKAVQQYLQHFFTVIKSSEKLPGKIKSAK